MVDLRWLVEYILYEQAFEEVFHLSETKSGQQQAYFYFNSLPCVCQWFVKKYTNFERTICYKERVVKPLTEYIMLFFKQLFLSNKGLSINTKFIALGDRGRQYFDLLSIIRLCGPIKVS